MGDDEVEVGESDEELGGASANSSTRWQRIRPEFEDHWLSGSKIDNG